MLLGPFRFDESNTCVWHGAEAVMLTPKAFAVLRHLISCPNRLVTKEELLNAGTELFRPYWLASLAEVHGKEGRVDESLKVLTEALSLIARTGEDVYAAELWRLKGESLLALSSRGGRGKQTGTVELKRSRAGKTAVSEGTSG